MKKRKVIIFELDPRHDLPKDRWSGMPESPSTLLAKPRKYSTAQKIKQKERAWRGQGIKDFFFDDYVILQIEQEDRCAICNVHVSQLKRGLVVDHDHETGAVRGLLCHGCNRGLGFLQDCPSVLESATIYLKNHHENRNRNNDIQQA